MGSSNLATLRRREDCRRRSDLALPILRRSLVPFPCQFSDAPGGCKRAAEHRQAVDLPGPPLGESCLHQPAVAYGLFEITTETWLRTVERRGDRPCATVGTLVLGSQPATSSRLRYPPLINSSKVTCGGTGTCFCSRS